MSEGDDIVQELIVGGVGVLLVGFGILFFILELKFDLPFNYGGKNTVHTNCLASLIVGVALIFFRNGTEQMNFIIYGIFITIELIILVLYFIFRNYLIKEVK